MKPTYFIPRYRALLLSLLIGSLHAYDNPHFYRATNAFFFEPRFAKKNLSSFDAALGYGSTDESRPKHSQCNSCEKTRLLDYCGFHNMQQLAVGVPNKDMQNPLDFLITQLSVQQSRDNFAHYSIGGDFKLTEVTLSWMHNFTDHFFIHLHMPVRRFNLHNICFQDLSPTDSPTPNSNSPLWQAFKTSFDAILARYNLSYEPYKKTALGDLTIFAGLTYNYQDTDVLDFVDATFRLGVITPTGHKQNPDKIFSIPHGHNGNIGVSFVTDFAVGAFEWLTLGAHLDVAVFNKKNQTIRMKTGLQQSGLIYLAKGDADVDRGNQLVGGGYIKADHVIRGFSATIGYSYARKSDDKVAPCDTKIFCPSIVNSNECLKGWKMHTLHLFFEYDLTKEDDKIGPRIGVYYNHQIAGRRVFKTDMVGATLGVELMWDF